MNASDLNGTTPVRVGVALGGGGVRGAAHIGVLAALDDAGLSPDIVTGTSAGAVVGALYCAGHRPTDISALSRTLRWPKLIRPTLTRHALFDPARLADLLADLLGHSDFTGLKRPFAAMACDLTTGQAVALSDGPVASAVLASCAIPGVFPPVRRGGRVLVDGGLADLVPATLARTLGADVVIAVDVSGPMPRREPRTLVQILVAAAQLETTSPRLDEVADLVLRPRVDEYALWELDRMPDFERAGRDAAGDAAPLVHALAAAAGARREWRRHNVGSDLAAGRRSPSGP